MLDKVLGQDIPAGLERQNFLRDNCDSVEMLDYTKELNEERRNELKESLVDKNIQLRDVRADKRAADELYKEQDKAYKNQIKHLERESEEIAKTLKEKAEFVREDCFKFIDEETRTAGYYDNEGVLRYTRSDSSGRTAGTLQMRFAAPEQKAKEKPIINLLNH